MSAQPELLTERHGARLTLRLNRPARKNALDSRSYRALSDALRIVHQDPSIRVVVLTATGDDFCSGQDLAETLDEGDHPLRWLAQANEVPRLLHDLPVPTIAQVDGAAFGAGWNLALACDIVVASERARFCQAFTKRGLNLDLGGSWLLPRLAGVQQAKRLALLAETIDAYEAERLGLVTFVEPVTSLSERVDQLAAQLATGPAVAMTQTKQLLDEGLTQSFTESLASEARAQAVNLATEDTAVAFRAFLQKSQPIFTGRWAVRAAETAAGPA